MAQAVFLVEHRQTDNSPGVTDHSTRVSPTAGMGNDVDNGVASVL